MVFFRKGISAPRRYPHHDEGYRIGIGCGLGAFTPHLLLQLLQCVLQRIAIRTRVLEHHLNFEFRIGVIATQAARLVEEIVLCGINQHRNVERKGHFGLDVGSLTCPLLLPMLRLRGAEAGPFEPTQPVPTLWAELLLPVPSVGCPEIFRAEPARFARISYVRPALCVPLVVLPEVPVEPEGLLEAGVISYIHIWVPPSTSTEERAVGWESSQPFYNHSSTYVKKLQVVVGCYVGGGLS